MSLLADGHAGDEMIYKKGQVVQSHLKLVFILDVQVLSILWH